MRNITCGIADIRKRVFAEVAKMAYDADYSRMEKLPYEIVPAEEGAVRESIFLERAIVGERIRLAMGLPLRSVAEHNLLSDGVEESAIAEKYYDPPLINIIKYACNACPPIAPPPFPQNRKFFPASTHRQKRKKLCCGGG